jgi:hypothetical protein
MGCHRGSSLRGAGAREGRLGDGEPVSFAPAVIACEAAAAPSGGSAVKSAERIEIVLADGIRIVVDGTIEPSAWRRSLVRLATRRFAGVLPAQSPRSPRLALAAVSGI